MQNGHRIDEELVGKLVSREGGTFISCTVSNPGMSSADAVKRM